MASNTVILGAGIVGCSTAYFLARSSRTQPQTVHLVEASDQLFHCASGLAGGFLAADWFAPSVAPLGALSFKLHKQLAAEHNGAEQWGYCRSTGTSLSQDSDVVVGSGEDWLRDGTSRAAAAGKRADTGANLPAWITLARGASLEVISTEDTTAQIDPKRFCEFLLAQSLDRGVHLHKSSKAISVTKDSNGKLASIRIRDKDGVESDLPCTRLLIACGAWSPKVFASLFPRALTQIPVAPLAGHSLLVRSPRWTTSDEAAGCHAVFTTDTLGFSPEVFSRLNGELYVAGLNSTTLPLPGCAGDAKPQVDAIQQLKGIAARLLGRPDAKDDLEILRESLCFRPVTASGRPIVARIPDAKLGADMATYEGGKGGVFVATGHGAWGVSQSLGTGKVMSQLMEGLHTSVNIKALELP